MQGGSSESALYLRASRCRFDVSGRFSCQLACYPGKGARYVRHTDASSSAPDRTVTALLYLNPEWDAQVGNGSALCNSNRVPLLQLYDSIATHGRPVLLLYQAASVF